MGEAKRRAEALGLRVLDGGTAPERQSVRAREYTLTVPKEPYDYPAEIESIHQQLLDERKPVPPGLMDFLSMAVVVGVRVMAEKLRSTAVDPGERLIVLPS